MTQSSPGTDRPHTSSDATDLGSMRQTYGGDDDLVAAWLDGGWRPLALAWLDHAIDASIAEPNAMVLATVDGDGHPATRTVLCKSIDDDGVVFYTNYDSDKGRHLAAHPYASATFPWIGVERQITFRGSVVRVDPQQTLEYWNSRPRGSQLGAWASEQSRPAADRAELDARLADVTARFDGLEVPVPPNWGGLRIVASSVEFWQGRNNRMHNRIRFDVDSASVIRLQP